MTLEYVSTFCRNTIGGHYNEYIKQRMKPMTTIQEMTSIENMALIQQFVDYVDSFYGSNDPLYPMMSRETKQPLTQMDIHRATANYLVMCLDENEKLCTWGDGDSLDRERVRDILLYDYNYKFVGE